MIMARRTPRNYGRGFVMSRSDRGGLRDAKRFMHASLEVREWAYQCATDLGLQKRYKTYYVGLMCAGRALEIRGKNTRPYLKAMHKVIELHNAKQEVSDGFYSGWRSDWQGGDDE